MKLCFRIQASQFDAIKHNSCCDNATLRAGQSTFDQCYDAIKHKQLLINAMMQ
jgi:hypothetical protein